MGAELAGRRVLVTRPTGQNEGLEQALRARGAQALVLPLFRIEGTGDAVAQRQTLQAWRSAAGWIFTSANAVRFAAACDRGAWPRVYAIGAATARMLAQHGHPEATEAADGSTSEALLRHPDLQSIAGTRFLVCTGAGGRDLLAQTLQARGAEVQRLDLYRRVAVEHAAEAVEAAVRAADAVICTSGEGVHRLHALTPAALREGLGARVLVVPSPRVLEIARGLGFHDVRVPATISDEALVGCLCAPR